MAVLNVNQNKQFFVVDKVVTSLPANLGEAKVVTNKAKDEVMIQLMGTAGIVKSDYVKVNTVTQAEITEPAKMKRKLKKATVVLADEFGEPIVGQDYVLRIQIDGFLGAGDDVSYVKSAGVHVTSGMNAEALYKKFEEVLTKSFSREAQPMFKFSSSTAGLVIEEVEQPWRRGLLNSEPLKFTVTPTTIVYGGDDVIWGEVEYADSATVIKNGKQIADMEVFCMGERGDMFRGMGYPYSIDVQYMVDPSKEYYVLDVHHSYAGNGVENQKSEKELCFVCTTKDPLDTLMKAFTGTTV